MWRAFLTCVLAAIITAAAFAEVSHSAEAETKILDQTIAKYEEAAKRWEPVLSNAAKRLFSILCVISLVFTAGWGYLRGNMTIGDFFSEFIRFGITMGIFYWLMENGAAIAKAIIDSMILLGQRASSDYVVQLTPSDICTQGFSLIYSAVEEFGKSSYATGIVVILVALGIAVIFGVIAAQMVVLLCSAWVLIYGGVFYLGFGGGNWTNDIAKNYFKTVLALAMQIFTFCLLIGIGQNEIKNLTTGLRTSKIVTVANYWWMYGLGGPPTKTITSETLTLGGMCVCLVFALVLAILVSRVPGLIAGVVTGSSITAMAFSGVGASVGTAAGIASGAVMGGSMIAGQAIHAGAALNSAYKQSVSNMASGAGKFTGATPSGGLAGAMSNGLTFASDMMTNLASGGTATPPAGKSPTVVAAQGGENAGVEQKDAESFDEGGGSISAGNDNSEGGKRGEESAETGIQPMERNWQEFSKQYGADYDRSKTGLPDAGKGPERFGTEWDDEIAKWNPRDAGRIDDK